ncbi:MAG: diguanylate cyclase [Candidatus Omnitrophota bacterium]
MQVLVADKDPSVLSLVSTRLKMRGYRVVACPASEAVWKELRARPFDLLLLGANLERIGEKTLVEKIRAEYQWRAVPVIMMATESQIAALLSSHERGFDDFLIKPFSALALQLRVRLNLSRLKERTEANALTHLPGNIAIERIIRGKIKAGEKFSVLYIDINHFKSFNDRYGFDKGDAVLRQTGKILTEAKKTAGGKDCFIGHVGGDDFVAVLDPDHEASFAGAFIAEFDRIIPTYYGKAEQERGSIRVTNRKGEPEVFPLMSCSVAGCTNLYRDYKSLGEIAQDAAELKSFLKSQPGSRYLRDRRSAPIEHLDQAVEILGDGTAETRAQPSMAEPLGKILVNAGLISEEDLAEAMKRHLETGRRLGQTLIAMNLVRSQDVGRMLEKKLNVPYVSLRGFRPAKELLRVFTREFLKAHRVVPLEISGREFRLAMCDPFDLKTLDAIERITGLRPVPVLALEDEFEDFLETVTEEKEPSPFDRFRSSEALR